MAVNVDRDLWYKEDMSHPSNFEPVNDEKHPLQLLAERTSLNVRSYSGRGMRGRQCLGIVAENVGEVVAAIVGEIRDLAREDAIGDEQFGEVQRAFEGMKTDSMGHDIIVYFPSVPFYVTSQDAEEEDEEAEEG